MIESNIVELGRGPQIEGSRITVFDIIQYHKNGWQRDEIAALFELSSQQVEAAMRYIDEHRAQVMAAYERNMERVNRGNLPEIQAKLDAGRERFLAAARANRERRIPEARDEGCAAGR